MKEWTNDFGGKKVETSQNPCKILHIWKDCKILESILIG